MQITFLTSHGHKLALHTDLVIHVSNDDNCVTF